MDDNKYGVRHKNTEHCDDAFQNQPNSLHIVITWCYRKPFCIVFPPCTVSNPTCDDAFECLDIPQLGYKMVTSSWVSEQDQTVCILSEEC